MAKNYSTIYQKIIILGKTDYFIGENSYKSGGLGADEVTLMDARMLIVAKYLRFIPGYKKRVTDVLVAVDGATATRALRHSETPLLLLLLLQRLRILLLYKRLLGYQ